MKGLKTDSIFSSFLSVLNCQRRKQRISGVQFASVLAFLFVLIASTEGRPGSVSSSDHWDRKIRDSAFSHSYSFSESDDEDDQMDSIISIIVGVSIFVFVAILAFLLCLCCPICILAKMRSRRRGGVVYRSAVETTNGTTVTTEQTRNGTTITVGRPRPQNSTPASNLNQPPITGTALNSSQFIAISNNSNQQNKPYPVQQSVTVVPVINPVSYPQQLQYSGGMMHGYHQQSPYAMPTTGPQGPSNEQYPSSDLPPPYPGLPREMDSTNLPYNPYYQEENSNPSAPIFKH